MTPVAPTGDRGDRQREIGIDPLADRFVGDHTGDLLLAMRALRRAGRRGLTGHAIGRAIRRRTGSLPGRYAVCRAA